MTAIHDDKSLRFLTGGTPYCCDVSCLRDAVVRIYDTRPETPYDVAETHACADHVHEMGGGESYAVLYRFGDDSPIADAPALNRTVPEADR